MLKYTRCFSFFLRKKFIFDAKLHSKGEEMERFFERKIGCQIKKYDLFVKYRFKRAVLRLEQGETSTGGSRCG